MSTLDEAWDDVGEKFKRLGLLFKDHYGSREQDAEATVSEEEVAAAIDVLGESIRSAVGAAGETIKDPELKAEARAAAGSLFTAIGLTFEEIAAQITTSRDGAPTASEDVTPADTGEGDEEDPA